MMSPKSHGSSKSKGEQRISKISLQSVVNSHIEANSTSECGLKLIHLFDLRFQAFAALRYRCSSLLVFGLSIPFDPIKIRSYLSYSIATVVLQESVMPYDSI
jgi:hypothetical protein